MTDPDIDALAAALGIPMRPEFRDGVATNLAVSLRLATMVAAFPLDDEEDLAPIFQA